MDENKRLLEELVNHRLDDAMSLTDKEAKDQSFKEAMEAVDRLNEMQKIENSVPKWTDRVFDVGFKVLEVAVIPVSLKVLDFVFDKKKIRIIGTIEQMECFTSTPGKAIGKMFKF